MGKRGPPAKKAELTPLEIEADYRDLIVLWRQEAETRGQPGGDHLRKLARQLEQIADQIDLPDGG